MMYNLKVEGINFCNQFIIGKKNTLFTTSFLPKIYACSKEHGKMVTRSFNTGKGSVMSFLCDDIKRVLAVSLLAHVPMVFI